MPPKRSVPGTGSGAVRPTGSSTAANPTVHAPSAPADEVVASTIDKSPSPGHRTLQLPAEVDDPSIHHDGDDPGPSSLFMPPSRSPSPALPDLRSKPFPPDAVEAAAYDSDDEDDEVLAVLPVYMGSALHQELHVYQYPLHTQSRPLQAPLYALDRGKDITVRVKEQVDRIEVEVPVDRGEEVWRTEEAESMGFVAAEGPGGSNGHTYGQGEIVGGVGYEGSAAQASRKKKKEAWGESMRLSSENMPKATPYFAGVVVEGKFYCYDLIPAAWAATIIVLVTMINPRRTQQRQREWRCWYRAAGIRKPRALHLHPIKKIQQFRTNLAYLDERDKRRNGAEEEEQPAAPPKKAPAPPPGARAKKEEVNDGSGSIIDFRNKLRSVTAAEAADKWVPYEWSYGIDRDDVSESYDKLLLPEDKRVRLKTSTKPLDYVDKVQ